MKKFIVALLAICFLSVSAQAAYADVISEPDNTFFDEYYVYMVPLDREFIVNGEHGFTQAQSEPGVQNVIGTFQNGDRCYITYSCLYDGEYWGVSYIGEIGYGWFRLAEMLVLYDAIAFEEEHSADFYEYTGDFEELLREGSVIIWEWPGSDITFFTFEIFDEDNIWITRAYMDAQGREWGYLDFYGKGGWVCLSDPMNYDLPPMDPMPSPSPWASETKHTDISTIAKSNNSPIILIVIVVAAVVAVTVLLIRKLFKPNKKA